MYTESDMQAAVPTEIMIEIASFCPPITLIRLHATCKWFHDLRGDALWAPYLRSPLLRTRPFVNLPDSLSPKQKVIRLLRGCKPQKPMPALGRVAFVAALALDYVLFFGAFPVIISLVGRTLSWNPGSLFFAPRLLDTAIIASSTKLALFLKRQPYEEFRSERERKLDRLHIAWSFCTYYACHFWSVVSGRIDAGFDAFLIWNTIAVCAMGWECGEFFVEALRNPDPESIRDYKSAYSTWSQYLMGMSF